MILTHRRIKFLKNTPPPNSTPEQIKEWCKYIDNMKEMEEQEQKQESEGLLVFKLIAGLAAAVYGLYLIFA